MVPHQYYSVQLHQHCSGWLNPNPNPKRPERVARQVYISTLLLRSEINNGNGFNNKARQTLRT